jgi:hypothetical protein
MGSPAFFLKKFGDMLGNFFIVLDDQGLLHPKVTQD